MKIDNEFELFKKKLETDTKNQLEDASNDYQVSKNNKPIILIVDDEPNVRESLETILKLKFTIILCSKGEEAIRKINSEISTVILDIKMEGKNGFETFIEIKNRFPFVPIIFHSAYQDIKNPFEIMNDYRPFGYVIKEGDGKKLFHTIDSAVNYFEQINQNNKLVSQLQRKNEVLQDLSENLEVIIKKRNAELIVSNEELHKEIEVRKKMEITLIENQNIVNKKLNSILSPTSGMENIELSDIIDKEIFQSLMDDFYAITKIGIGILDVQGNVLIATGWQDVCTKFHRVNPISCQNCLESDTILSKGVAKGEFKLYHCKNNLWDIVTPIIVGEKHFGNIFLGQFLFEGEEINLDIFRMQAKKFNFEENAYLSAIEKIPVWSKNTVESVITFYTKLSDIIAKLSYSNISLARSIAEQQRAEDKIQLLLEEKEILLKEVHHRIKNNMTTLKSLLSLQARTLSDQTAINALNNAENRIQSIMILYDKLYQSDNLEAMPISDYLPTLIDEIIGNFPNNTQVIIDLNIQDFILNAKNLQSLGIIINELLTNIMKYAFMDLEKGKISIEIGVRTENKLNAFLIIQDNGKGIPESIGFETSTGFGLRLISLLTRQLKGNIQIENKNGTRVTLDFLI